MILFIKYDSHEMNIDLIVFNLSDLTVDSFN